jgi:ubiquinone/menaquinone biosynthesis C-methylase UbiE
VSIRERIKSMSMNGVSVKELEQVEIGRSKIEARNTDTSALQASESTINRYMNPPADTCFPLEYAYHLLGDVRGKSVLEFGCGSGENTVLLARRGAKVCALDISEALIRVAKKRLEVNGINKGVKLCVASAYQIPLPDESIDVVFGIAILHHLELERAAREVRRVLRKGGKAIFKEPIRNSKLLGWVRGLIPYRAPDVSPFERPLTDAEMKNFAEGYSHYHSKAFMLPSMRLANILPVMRNHTESLHRIDGAILNKFPSLAYYGTVRVVEMIK